MTVRVRHARHSTFLAAIVGLAFAAPCASADLEDQETYRCSAPHGQSDASAFLIPGQATEVKGKITLHTADIGPEWASMGHITVHQHGSHYNDGDCGCNGIAVYALDPKLIEFRLMANGEEAPITRGPYNTPISFMISTSPQGVMTVTIGETNPKTKSVTLRHPEHNSLEMSCSGADISYLGIATL